MGIYAFFPWIWIWFNKFFHSTGPIHPFVLGDPISLKCAIDYANGVLFREFSTVPMSLSKFSTLPYMIFRVFSLMKIWRSIWSFHFSRDENIVLFAIFHIELSKLNIFSWRCYLFSSVYFCLLCQKFTNLWMCEIISGFSIVIL